MTVHTNAMKHMVTSAGMGLGISILVIVSAALATLVGVRYKKISDELDYSTGSTGTSSNPASSSSAAENLQVKNKRNYIRLASRSGDDPLSWFSSKKVEDHRILKGSCSSNGDCAHSEQCIQGLCRSNN